MQEKSSEIKTVNKNSIKKFVETSAGIWALLVLVLAFYLMNNSFLNTFNIKNLFNNLATLLVMCCGATLLRLIGSLDLSMGNVASVANVVFVSCLPALGGASYIVTLGFGFLSGLLLGIIHAKLKIPSFIASLAFMNIWHSVGLLIVKTPFSVSKANMGYIGWGSVKIGIIDLPSVIAIVLVILFSLYLVYTVSGRSLSIIGGNERAARLAGIRTDRYKILSFAICGVTSAICGIILAVRLRSCDPRVGDPYTLLAYAAVFLIGGRGGTLKTLLGVCIITVINNGMTIVGVDAVWTQIVFGALIILSMILTMDRGGQKAIVK
jgi:ribose/xylose/arabinose/galactoside ABC-type transport system permease subunit